MFPDQAQSDNLQQMHSKFPKFFQKFFTLCNYYLSLFAELGRASSSSADHSDNISLAKSFMRDLFSNLDELKSAEDANLGRIISNCATMLRENN